MKDKITKIQKINDDIKYLYDEYERVKMWGSCPDGDLKFEALMEWLSNDDNASMMEFMIKVSKDVKAI